MSKRDRFWNWLLGGPKDAPPPPPPSPAPRRPPMRVAFDKVKTDDGERQRPSIDTAMLDCGHNVTVIKPHHGGGYAHCLVCERPQIIAGWASDGWASPAAMRREVGGMTDQLAAAGPDRVAKPAAELPGVVEAGGQLVHADPGAVAVAKSLYDELDEGHWDLQPIGVRAWWVNRGHETEARSRSWSAWDWETQANCNWAFDGGHLFDRGLSTPPALVGSEYDLAKNRRHAKELRAKGHDPVEVDVVIYRPFITRAHAVETRLPDGSTRWQLPDIEAHPDCGFIAKVVTMRCQGDCRACAIERVDGGDEWLRANTPLDPAEVMRRLERIEAKLGLTAESRDAGADDYYSLIPEWGKLP